MKENPFCKERALCVLCFDDPCFGVRADLRVFPESIYLGIACGLIPSGGFCSSFICTSGRET